MEINFNIVFTQKAKTDLNKIYKYIFANLKEKGTAIKMLKTIREQIMVLKDIPEGFSIVKFYNKKKYEYRRLTIKNYVVIYRIDKVKKTVYIVKIVNGRKNYLND